MCAYLCIQTMTNMCHNAHSCTCARAYTPALPQLQHTSTHIFMHTYVYHTYPHICTHTSKCKYVHMHAYTALTQHHTLCQPLPSIVQTGSCKKRCLHPLVDSASCLHSVLLLNQSSLLLGPSSQRSLLGIKNNGLGPLVAGPQLGAS